MTVAIGDLVRLLRQESRLSQRDFAVLTGTSGPTVSAYESGAKEARWSTLERMAAAMGWIARATVVPSAAGDRQRQRRELRSLAVAAVVAAAVARDFSAAQRLGRANLSHTAGQATSPRGRRWIEVWADALEAGPADVEAILLDRSDDGHDLRQMSPLAGLITDEERRAALASADALWAWVS